jgi:hypothetical protein
MVDLEGKPITREEYEQRWKSVVGAGGVKIIIDHRKGEARLAINDKPPAQSDVVY